MCNASGVALGVVLGQCKGYLFHPIYYTRKTLDVAKKNYNVVEQELLVVVYAFEKLRSYSLGSGGTHQPYYYTLMAKNDEKPSLI